MAGTGGVRIGAGRKQGGHNKAKLELKEIARAYTDVALKALVDVMNQVESPNARVSAARELLDRGWGKSIQAVDAPLTPPGDDTRLINGDKVLPPLIPLFKLWGVE